MLGFGSRQERHLPASEAGRTLSAELYRIQRQSRAMEVCRALLIQAQRAENDKRPADAEQFWREINQVLKEADCAG